MSTKAHLDREETIIKIGIGILDLSNYLGKYRIEHFSELLKIPLISKFTLNIKENYPLYIHFEVNSKSKDADIFGYLILADFIEENEQKEPNF